jgi:hypothetical protein
MTDQKQNRQPCRIDQPRKPETIGEHFSNDVSIEELSCEEITAEESYRAVWERVEEYCGMAVDAKKDLAYLGRKTHGILMIDAMLLMRSAGENDPPSCWYPLAKELRANPPVFTQSDNDPAQVFRIAAEYAGIPWASCDCLRLNEARSIRSYRDGWLWMAQWRLDRDSSLSKLRDWLWENDAMPDKPSTPPWFGK